MGNEKRKRITTGLSCVAIGLTLAAVLGPGLAAVQGCGGIYDRQLTYHPVRSNLMSGAQLSYSVWTPPDFREDEELPLVLFLHGGGDDPASFDRHGLTDTFNAAVLAGEIPRVVIFFPQGDNGFWANWHDGTRRYQDWIIGELLPEVATRYHTAPCPEACHLMGVSMGGYGSLRLALDRPGIFATVTPISAPIFDTEQMTKFSRDRMTQLFIPTHRIWGPADPTVIAQRDPFRTLRSASDIGGAFVTIRWGTDDRPGIMETNVRFAEHLEEQGIPHTAGSYEGNHSWVSWSPVIREALVNNIAP